MPIDEYENGKRRERKKQTMIKKEGVSEAFRLFLQSVAQNSQLGKKKAF